MKILSFKNYYKIKQLETLTNVSENISEGLCLEDYNILCLNEENSYGASVLLTKMFQDRFSIRYLLDMLEDGDDHWILVKDKEVKAFCTVMLSEAGIYICNFCSDIEGGGTALMNHLFNSYNDDFFLHSMNDKVCSFYEKFGFIKLKKNENGTTKMMRVKL